MADKTRELPRHQNRKGREKETGAVVFNYDLFRFRTKIVELNAAIAAYALSDRFSSDYEFAMCEYFECRDIVLVDEEADPEEFFRDEDEFARFITWFCTYGISGESGRTFPECYLAENPDLPPIALEILQSHVDSFPCLYEVQWTKPGAGLEIRDLLGEARFVVYDECLSRRLCRWDLVYGGLLRIRDLYFFSGFDPIIVPPRWRDEIEKSVERFHGDAAGEKTSNRNKLFKKSGLQLFAVIENACRSHLTKTHLKNTDSDPLVFVTLHYRIKDKEKFFREIAACPAFLPAGGRSLSAGKATRSQFIWCGNERESDRDSVHTTKGILLLDADALKARCNSRERAEALKLLMADTFTTTLELKMTLYEQPQEERLEESPSFRGEPSGGDLPQDVSGLRDESQRHYKGWVDEKLPALGNMSPREAMASPQSRKHLINLLKELENQSERAIRKGLKNAAVLGFPADMIREELGLII